VLELEALVELKLSLQLAQPSQIVLRVGQSFRLALNTNLSMDDISITASLPGFVSIDPATGSIQAIRAGGMVVLVIKSDAHPELKPLNVVVITVA